MATQPPDDDEEMRLAMELSKRTFEDEERRRKANDRNLISFESFEEREQTRKVSEIQNIVRKETYGWRNPVAQLSQPQHSQYSNHFPPPPPAHHYSQPGVNYVQPPPLPPPRAARQQQQAQQVVQHHQPHVPVLSTGGLVSVLPHPHPHASQQNNHRLSQHLNTCGGVTTLSTVPQVPQRTYTPTTPRSTTSTPTTRLDSPRAPIAWRVQFSPSPAHHSIDLWKNRESQVTGTSLAPPETHANDLYVPYSMLTTQSKNIQGGDLIDLDTPSKPVEKATLDQIRREFDPLYDIGSPMPHSLVGLERTKSLRTENVDAHLHQPTTAAIKTTPVSTKIPRRSESVDCLKSPGRDQEWLTIDCIKIHKNTTDVQRQVAALRSHWNQRDPDCSRFFNSPIVDYMTTAVVSVKVEVYKDHTWPRSGEELMSMTCETSTGVDMILTEVLARFLEEKQMTNRIPVEDYGLKVFGLDEYLPPDSQLGQNLYVGKSLLFDKDVKLEIGLKKMDHLRPGTSQADYTELQKNKTRVPCSNVLDAEDIQNLLIHLREDMKLFELDAVENNQLSVSATSNKVRQYVKMLCKMLNGIEPVALHTNLKKYLTAGNENQLRCASTDFIASLHAFISAFCKSTMSNYAVIPLRPPPTETKKVYEVSEKLKIMVNSLHSLRDEWIRLYEHFYVTVHIYYGTQQLDGHENVYLREVQNDAFFPYVNMNLYASFNTEIRLCPRETKLMFLLWGERREPMADTETLDGRGEHLAVASIPLFDYKNMMRQGQLFVPLSTIRGPIIQPWGAQPLICSERDAVLLVTLPNYHYNVVFPDVEAENQCSKMDIHTLSLDQREFLLDLVETIEPEKLTVDDRESLWQNKHYLMNMPEALPLVLASVPNWGYGFLSTIYPLLEDWAPLSPVQAIQLLLPQYPDCRIRAKAIEYIKLSSSDFLFNFLPQLVEALRFETYENSPLSIFLIALTHKDRRFAFEIYWQLQQRIDHCPYNDFSASTAAYVQRCQLLQKELLDRHASDALCHEICLQHRLLNTLDDVQRELKNVEDSHKLQVLRTKLGILDSEVLQSNIRLPILPSFICSGIDVAKCSIFNSNAKPLRITFRGLRSAYTIIHKDGDDMRQDALVLQMVRLMNDVWLSDNLDLKMVTFRCMPVGFKRGMAEIVGDCATLCDIQKVQGVAGVFKDDVLCKWLERYNATEYSYKVALDNFQRSCAGWCVATYVLGIGDRHNDNILLTSMGHVFHIDFGKYMGDWQMAGGFRRDRVPFVFTKEMYTVINGGSEQSSERYQTFIDYCCRAFNYLRKKHSILTNLIKIMACSDIPGINIESLQFVEKNLMLDLSETDATMQFTQLITVSLKSAFPRLNFFVHTLAQLISAGGNAAVRPADADQELSFVPHRYTKETDGKIKMVRVVGTEKHSMPQKVYLYKVEVTRENETVRTTVYRSFAEFHELCVKLRYRFPTITMHPLARGSMMRSNIREVALRRMEDIMIFLETLFRLPGEVSHCDLVYTFFHIILRDNNLENAPEERSGRHRDVQVFLKLAWDLSAQKMKIFVGHVKHLPMLSTGQAPDAYVKTYIRPDDCFVTQASKRKTAVVKSSQNPTFNEELVYDLRSEKGLDLFFDNHLLEVSIWNSGGLGDNNKMFLLCIPLKKILQGTEGRKGSVHTEGWYTMTRMKRDQTVYHMET